MVQIPFKDGPSFVEQVLLDNVPYKLKFSWNTRAEVWNLDILDVEDTLLISGISVVQGVDLLAQYVYKNIPQGQLYANDSSGNGAPIEYDDFRNDRAMTILYVEEGEVI